MDSFSQFMEKFGIKMSENCHLLNGLFKEKNDIHNLFYFNKKQKRERSKNKEKKNEINLKEK